MSGAARIAIWAIRTLWSVLHESEPEISDEERWPSVHVAYEFVKPTYDQVARRIDAQENRIRATMTFATTVSFAVLTFLTGPLNKRDFGSAWLLAAVGTYVLLMLAGILAVFFSETRLVNPNRIYNTMLGLSEWEFKRDAIARAGADFVANANTAARLNVVAIAMAVMMTAEISCLGFWATQAPQAATLPIF